MGLLSDGVSIGTTLYNTIEQPHVQKTSIKYNGQLMDLTRDDSNISGIVYSISPHVEDF